MRNEFRLIGRLFCLVALLVAWAIAPAGVCAQASGPAMTQVTDTVYRADGTAAKGTVLISWPGFTTADGKAVAAGALSVQLGNGGAFTASLAPNTGAQPAGVFYKVVYQLVGQEPSTEYWVVPSTGSTTIGAVRAKLQPPTIAAQILTRDVADTNYVHVSGNSTVNGVVTFSASPGMPTPQNPGDAANKGYVDSVTAGIGNLTSPPPIGGTTPNSGVFTNINGVIYVDGIVHKSIASALTACTGPCVVDSRGHYETFASTVTFPSYPVTLLLGPYTYTGPASGPMFVVNSYLSNGSRIVGYGMTSANQANQGNGTTLKAANGNSNDLVQLLSGSSGVLQGLTLSDLTLDGNNSSASLLDLDAVRHSYFLRLNFQNCTNRMMYSYVSSSAVNQGTQFNVFDQITGGNCPQILYADGNSTAGSDFTQNNLTNWSVMFTSATLPGIVFHQADGNQGQNIKIFPAGNRYVSCLQFDTPVSGSVVGGLENRFFGLHTGCLNAGQTINAQSGTYGNRIYGYDQIEGQASPFGTGEIFWEGTTYQGVTTFAYGSLAKLTWNYDVLLGRCSVGQLSVDTDGSCNHSGDLLGNYFKAKYFDTFTGGTYSLNGTTVIDSSRNATVNNLTVSGTCTGCGGGTANLASPPAIGNTTPNTGAFTTLQADDLSSKNYPVIDVRAWGAVGDGKFIPDNCAMTAGSNVVTCSGSVANPPMIATGPPFAAGDVGKTFWMPGAGNVGPNNYMVATIAGYISASQVKLSANALNTVARSSATYGHDNYAAFCAISNCTSATVPNNWYAWPRNGKQIHVPAGMYLTTHPLYVRNGDMWWGDGETASNLRLMSATNDLFVMCVDGNASAGTDTCTGDQFSAGASQTFTVKGFFLTNSSMNTDMTHGPTGIYVPPEASAYKLLDNWFDTSSTGIFVNKGNGGIIQNALCDFSVLLYCLAMDGGVSGDGGGASGEYGANNFATQVLNLNSWGQATAIGLHGVANVEISGLQSLFGTSEDVLIGQLIGRGSQSAESSRRVSVHDSFFQRGWTQSPGNPNTTMLDLREDCVSCSIVNNTFANSYKYDIALFQSTPLLNVDGLLIANNQFKDSQQYTTAGSGYASIYLANVGNTGQVTIANNHWENIGNVALWTNQNVNLLGNTCHNPLLRSAPANTTLATKSCWYFADGAAKSVARDNVTDSTSYGAVGISTAGGHGATLDSSGNRSQFATCDVCVTDAVGSTVTTLNERVSNDGASGTGAYAAVTAGSAVNAVNGYQVGGATVIDSSRNAAVNNLTVNGSCTGCGMSSNGYGYLVSKFASIQAAINAAYGAGVVTGKVIDDRTAAYSGAGFYVPDSVTVELAPVPYTFTGTVTHNNGNNNVTAAIVVEQGAHLKGSSTSSNHGTTIGVSAGFAGDIIATTSEGTGIGTTAQWWHWGSIENLNISGANQTSGRCLVVENMGETSRVENILARACYGNNIEIIGASATQSSIRNITTGRSQTASGIRFTNLAGVGKVDGLSGDCNPTALVSVQENAAGSLTILGLKAEGEASICTGTVQDPVILLDGMSGFNDHVRVIGGYAFGTAQSSFAKFVNAGNAILETDGLYITGYTNMLNDTVRSVTVPLSSSTSKQPFYYEPGGTTFANQAFTFAPGTFIQGGSSALTEIFGSSTDGSSMIAAQGNGDGTSYFTGGLKIGIPNRTQFGQPPEMMARMGSRFLGAGNGYDTNTWVFVPIWKTGDTSNRWIGEPNQRWPEVYAADVNATTATVGTLTVSNCVGCGASTTWGGIGGTLSSQADLQTALAGKQNALGYTPLNAANNLSDVANLATAKSNLGVPGAASTVPVMNGTGAVGVSTNYARADHVHPTDTSRVATSTTVNGHALSGNVTVTAGDVGAPHSISGAILGPTPAVTGTGAMTALYSVTIPAGTLSVGTGLRCVARARHTTGSASVSMAWRLGSTTYTYPSTYATGSTGSDASIEIFTFSSLTAETVNIPWASFGGTTETPYTGLAWSENVSGATTLQFLFAVASTDKLTGDSFYCTTIQ